MLNSLSQQRFTFPFWIFSLSFTSIGTACNVAASRFVILTPWCRVLVEQLTGLQLIKKFPAFHGTRRFITALTSVRHLSLFWSSPIQSIYPHPISWRSILILSTHLRLGLPSGLFPSAFPTKTLYTPLSSVSHSGLIYRTVTLKIKENVLLSTRCFFAYHTLLGWLFSCYFRDVSCGYVLLASS